MNKDMEIIKEYYFGDNELSAYWFKTKHNNREVKIIVFKNDPYVLNEFDDLENKIVSFVDENISEISRKAQIDVIKSMLEWYDIFIDQDFYIFLLEKTLMEGDREKETFVLCEYLLNLCPDFKQIDKILIAYTDYDPFLRNNILQKAYYETFRALAKTAILIANDMEDENI